jgi:hypothetical protein
MQLFNLCAKLIELRRLTDSGESTFTSVEQNLNALLLELKPIVGAQEGREVEVDEILEFDLQAAELRDEELHQVAEGRNIAELKEATSGLYIPEGRSMDGQNSNSP